ncbi:MAG: hypothetical protein KAJ14_06500 [Candidatus Omnitrophica bacterium]|nr:hypothetical protein [Candidatus Omnitrophota bacterium]MCK5492740.1 hypothetical protein [Candidatus Omnitrophota bacterium]
MEKIIYLFIAIMIFISSGCYGLRKKFIRKKKYQKEPTVYIDLKDYSTQPVEGEYLYYYLYLKGWFEELVKAVEKDISPKRQKLAANEVANNLERAMTFLNTEGKNEIYSIYEEFLELKKDIEHSSNFTQNKKNFLLLKIRSIKSQVERKFNWVDVKKWLI